VGKLTCHTPRGSSVIDYGVVSQCLIRDIKFFTVHRFLADLSDHCQISLLLYLPRSFCFCSSCLLRPTKDWSNHLIDSVFCFVYLKLNHLDKPRSSSPSDEIPVEEWFTYFKSLNKNNKNIRKC
jgi:hypothetical protein